MRFILACLAGLLPAAAFAAPNSYGSLNFDRIPMGFERLNVKLDEAVGDKIKRVDLSNLKTTHPEEFKLISIFFLAGGEGTVFLSKYHERDLNGPILVITKLPADFSKLSFWRSAGTEETLRKLPSQIGLALSFSKYADASVPIGEQARQNLGAFLFAGKTDLIMIVTAAVTADKLAHELHHLDQITSGYLDKIADALEAPFAAEKLQPNDEMALSNMLGFVYKMLVEHPAYEVQRQYLVANGAAPIEAENKLRGEHLLVELTIKKLMDTMSSEGKERWVQSACSVLRKELPAQGPFSGSGLTRCR